MEEKKHKRLTQSEKMEIIRMVDGSDASANKTLKELGINKSTFYHWYQRYLQGGFVRACPKQARTKPRVEQDTSAGNKQGGGYCFG